MKDKLYTAGEIAKLTGVSLRTIRFYDEKGLLKPVEMMKTNEDIGPQLSQQKSFLLQHKKQLEEIISTIEIMEKSNGEEKWNYLLHLTIYIHKDTGMFVCRKNIL